MHGSLTITVPDANPGVTGAEVAGAMTRVINAGAAANSSGEPSAIKKAELAATEVTDYNLG